MKKTILFFVILILMSCQKDDEIQSYLNFSVDLIECTHQSGQQFFLISTNQKWSIAALDDWCVPTHGNKLNEAGDDVLILLSIEPNDQLFPRETSIIVSLERGGEYSLKIKQQGKSDIQPCIDSFGFKMEDNSKILIYDVECSIQDNTISVLIPYLMPHKELIPCFTYQGQTVLVNGEIQESSVNLIDFSYPVEYMVTNESGQNITYTVIVKTYTGLPIVSIDTNDLPINSKDDYVNGILKISNTLNDEYEYNGSMRIRGRGNYTWSLPKKPYRIKLDEKASLFGIPADKDWVLLANYSDKSLIRTATAFELSRLVGMPWTPKSTYVDVFINGKYEGQYLLCEHVKVGSNRVDVSKTGALGEIDNYYYLEPFYTQSSKGKYYTFKEPDPATIENTAYFMSMVNALEDALDNNRFDGENGYRKYIDIESFAKWYIISQFLASYDNNYYVSVKNNVDAVLEKPLIWDLDWSMGYVATEWGFVNTISADTYIGYTYLYQMIGDNVFRQEVKKQWLIMKEQYIPLLYNFINTTSIEIRESADANFTRWDIMNAIGVTRLQKWENEVQFIKTFLSDRTVWMDNEMAEW